MFLRIEPSSAVPIYRQIMDQIRYQIARGGLHAGTRLPSVRDLARQLPANQNTVLKAYDLLAAEGVLLRRQGDGTFVAEAPPTLSKTERRRRLAALLGQAAAQAVHFDISPQELRKLLEEQIDLLAKRGP